MSEEVARSIGDVLAENEWLKRQLAQAEERARIASAAYHQQQDATREHEARYQAMTERALAAEQNAEEWKSIAMTTNLTAKAWEQAAVRLERRAEKTAAINRELNGHLLAAGAENKRIDQIRIDWLTRAFVLRYVARRLVAAWRAERQVATACLRSATDFQDKLDAWRAATSQALTARADGQAMDLHSALDALAELLNEGRSK